MSYKTCSFAVAKLVAWNGERGIAYDCYLNPVRFIATQVPSEDHSGLIPGAALTINSDGSVELASGSFNRFYEAYIQERTQTTVVVDMGEDNV